MDWLDDGGGGGVDMDFFYLQLQQKDISCRIQAGQQFLEYLTNHQQSADLEQDTLRLDKIVDEVTTWINSSNYKVSLLGLHILSALTDRLLERFRTYLATGKLYFLESLKLMQNLWSYDQ
ncbi:CLIP-associating protein 1-B-like [Discoglossus pictus]